MNYKQFTNLKPGDKVRLDFSNEPEQVVVKTDIDKETISTHPVGDNSVVYVNNYVVIGYVPQNIEDCPEKKQILEMFGKFVQAGCNNCPFRLECDNTYNETRAHSTDAFTICEALHKKSVDY